MNIQQYYRTVANASLNGSFAALVPIFIVIFPIYFTFPQKELVLLALPFLLYSFISYQAYILHEERAVNSEPIKPDSKTLTNKNQHLVAFLPAPSLRMLLFSPEGNLNGEIRDLRYTRFRWFLPYFLDKLFPAEYGLYNAENRLIASFKWKGKRTAEVYNVAGYPLFSLEWKESGVILVSTKYKVYKLITTSKQTFTDIQFIRPDGLELGRVRKGWMPVEWGKTFKDANTPVLTFHEKLSKEERLGISSILNFNLSIP